MEKGKYQQLSPEEIKKFEEENMTEEQEAMSPLREAAFEFEAERNKGKEINVSVEKLREAELLAEVANNSDYKRRIAEDFSSSRRGGARREEKIISSADVYKTDALNDEIIAQPENFSLDEVRDAREYKAKFSASEVINDEAVMWKAIIPEKGGRVYNTFALRYLSPELRNDKELFSRIIESTRYPGVLEYASTELRNNKEFVLSIIKQKQHDFEYAFQCASSELRHDKSLIIDAIKESEKVFKYIPLELQNDKEFVLDLISHRSEVFGYVSPEFKNNKEFVMKAMQYGGNLFYASFELQHDREVVLEGVKKIGTNLAFASPELKADLEVVLAAVKNNPSAVYNAPKKIQDKVEYFLTRAQINDH